MSKVPGTKKKVNAVRVRPQKTDYLSINQSPNPTSGGPHARASSPIISRITFPHFFVSLCIF
jgi:hypothetical protein